jgi:hypothetical protein
VAAFIFMFFISSPPYPRLSSFLFPFEWSRNDGEHGVRRAGNGKGWGAERNASQ